MIPNSDNFILCHHRKGELEVVEYLVENYKLDINMADKWGETPLDHAQE